LGLRTLNAEDAFEPSKTIVTGTLDLVKRADLICVVVDSPHSPNVLFELGFALGAGRPIVLIGDPIDLPSGLASQFLIRASASDTAAVTFQMRAFLDNLDRKKKGRRRKDDPVQSSNKIPKPTNKLVTSANPDSNLERLLLTELEHATEIASILMHPR